MASCLRRIPEAQARPMNRVPSRLPRFAAALLLALFAGDISRARAAAAAPGPRIEISFPAKGACATDHRPRVRRDQPQERHGRPSSRPTSPGVPLFGHKRHRTGGRRSGNHRCAGFRRTARQPARPAGRRLLDAAVTSTSTPSSSVPMATPCGCTWTSGKARTGSTSPGNLYGAPVKVHFDPASTITDPHGRRPGHRAHRSSRRHAVT